MHTETQKVLSLIKNVALQGDSEWKKNYILLLSYEYIISKHGFKCKQELFHAHANIKVWIEITLDETLMFENSISNFF